MKVSRWHCLIVECTTISPSNCRPLIPAIRAQLTHLAISVFYQTQPYIPSKRGKAIHLGGMDDHLSSSIKKRRRPALACTQCRRRKMRCDQNSPCNNCARSRRYECVYPADIQAGGSLPRTPSNHSLGTGRSEEQTARRLQTTASDDRAIQARADQDTRFGNGRDSGIGTSSSSGKDIDALPVEVQSLQARVNELENKLALALKSQTHERAAQSASTLNVKQRQRGEHRFANQSSWLNDTVLVCVDP